MISKEKKGVIVHKIKLFYVLYLGVKITCFSCLFNRFTEHALKGKS